MTNQITIYRSHFVTLLISNIYILWTSNGNFLHDYIVKIILNKLAILPCVGSEFVFSTCFEFWRERMKQVNNHQQVFYEGNLLFRYVGRTLSIYSCVRVYPRVPCLIYHLRSYFFVRSWKNMSSVRTAGRHSSKIVFLAYTMDHSYKFSTMCIISWSHRD